MDDRRMDDRTKLLHSLSIDRGPAAEAPRRRLWPVLVGGVAVTPDSLESCWVNSASVDAWVVPL
ncbi:hypothetical protein CH338_24940, partial [Rhodoplanes elegans]